MAPERPSQDCGRTSQKAHHEDHARPDFRDQNPAAWKRGHFSSDRPSSGFDRDPHGAAVRGQIHFEPDRPVPRAAIDHVLPPYPWSDFPARGFILDDHPFAIGPARKMQPVAAQLTGFDTTDQGSIRPGNVETVPGAAEMNAGETAVEAAESGHHASELTR